MFTLLISAAVASNTEFGLPHGYAVSDQGAP
jgi:hypothetical protein